MVSRRYLCKRAVPEAHDPAVCFALPRATVSAVKHVDLRPNMPSVYDQGELGSCTANALAGAYEYMQMHEKEKTHFTGSRLFIYYNERDIEHTITEDAGALISDGVKCLNTCGVCPESMWGYDISKFAQKPPANCYTEAKNHTCTMYHRVAQTATQIQQALIAGTPVVCGIQVYESFESDAVAKTGTVPMPTATEKCLGGHAIMLVGFDLTQNVFICRNSWGTGWGMHGYFTLPIAYITNPELSDDHWVLMTVVDKTIVKVTHFGALHSDLESLESSIMNFFGELTGHQQQEPQQQAVTTDTVALTTSSLITAITAVLSSPEVQAVLKTLLKDELQAVLDAIHAAKSS